MRYYESVEGIKEPDRIIVSADKCYDAAIICHTYWALQQGGNFNEISTPIDFSSEDIR